MYVYIQYVTQLSVYGGNKVKCSLLQTLVDRIWPNVFGDQIAQKRVGHGGKRWCWIYTKKLHTKVIVLPLNARQHVPPLRVGGSALSAGCASGCEPLQSQREITDAYGAREMSFTGLRREIK